MRELTGRKTKCQNILFTTSHRSKTISIPTYFKSLLPRKIAEFYNASLLKHIRLTNKLSVRKLRVFYLSLLGDKEK
ncbi:MAG: hypothetical protein HY223_01295 [Thaumarchaeota archaeon]|nr:hypothetical protein [Nitrososphaerota archaeon]